MPKAHEIIQSVADIIDKLDTQIGSYTNETTHEARARVTNTETGQTGIIVSKSVEDPEGGKGKGFVVQWLHHGGQTWFPTNELNKVNSKLKPEDPDLEDYLRTLWDTPEGPQPYEAK